MQKTANPDVKSRGSLSLQKQLLFYTQFFLYIGSNIVAFAGKQ